MSKFSEIQTEKHPKQDFQVERIAFFSDAVFAIAITLLIIEFRPPHVTTESTYSEIWGEVVHMRFKLGALLVSFALIVNYWIKHHTLFKHLHDYNPQIIKINMWLLLPVIFFPFTTSFLYESLETNNLVLVIPYRLFLLNNVLASAATYYLHFIITKKYRQYSYPVEKSVDDKFSITLLLMGVSFLTTLLISFLTFKYSIVGLLPIFLYKIYERIKSKNKSFIK